MKFWWPKDLWKYVEHRLYLRTAGKVGKCRRDLFVLIAMPGKRYVQIYFTTHVLSPLLLLNPLLRNLKLPIPQCHLRNLLSKSNTHLPSPPTRRLSTFHFHLLLHTLLPLPFPPPYNLPLPLPLPLLLFMGNHPPPLKLNLPLLI